MKMAVELAATKNAQRAHKLNLKPKYMKTKAILLIAATALVTLSFTFATLKKSPVEKKAIESSSNNAPVGGFASDDER
jgi:hypothetical protein